MMKKTIGILMVTSAMALSGCGDRNSDNNGQAAGNDRLAVVPTANQCFGQYNNYNWNQSQYPGWSNYNYGNNRQGYGPYYNNWAGQHQNGFCGCDSRAGLVPVCDTINGGMICVPSNAAGNRQMMQWQWQYQQGTFSQPGYGQYSGTYGGQGPNGGYSNGGYGPNGGYSNGGYGPNGGYSNVGAGCGHSSNYSMGTICRIGRNECGGGTCWTPDRTGRALYGICVN